MAGHSKWAQIKRQKGSEDAKKSKIFSKFSRLIASEAKRSIGNINSPSLRAVIERAKKENMPKDTILRAVKKGTEGGDDLLEVRYEAYGPGGAAIIIEGATDNKNRTVQEIKAILAEKGGTLAAAGAALWAFQKKEGGEYVPVSIVALSEKDAEALQELVESLLWHNDVEEIFTNIK